MKCALVIPSWRPEDIFPARTAASQINYWQPLGVLYVAACLRAAGHEVVFINGAFVSEKGIVDRLARARPGWVGVYATAFGWPAAKQMVARIKARLAGVKIAAGGPYPIAVKEQCLRECPGLDAVVTGEGEETVPEMIRRYEGGRSLAGVAGVAAREGQHIVLNPPRPFITDLDSIPFPARDLLGDAGAYIPPPATYRRKPVAVMMTSRGCDRRCIYCFQMDKSRKSGIRYRGIANVMAEIEQCLAQGYREIKFIDETLAADYDRALDLAREIGRRGLDFTWFASACVNQVDERLFRAFRKAGCWAVLLGAESGVQKDLNTIRKGITPGQIAKAVRAAQRAGLTVFTPFLFGIPGQTYADGLKTIEFACKLNPDVANFHSLTPFPGTELHDNIGRYGRIAGGLDERTYQGAAFVPHSMTREEILSLRQLAFKRFYSRPSFLARRLLRIRSLDDLRAACAGLKSLFWLHADGALFHRGRRSSHGRWQEGTASSEDGSRSAA